MTAFNIDGKIALVSGASRGIGESITKAGVVAMTKAFAKAI